MVQMYTVIIVQYSWENWKAENSSQISVEYYLLSRYLTNAATVWTTERKAWTISKMLLK